MGLFSLEKTRVRDGIIVILQHLKRDYKKDGEGHFTRMYSHRTRGNAFKVGLD